MEFEEVVEKRRSIRKFSRNVPDWRDVIECIDKTRYTPMAGDNFSLKFVLIEDQEKIKKLATEADQDFIKEAPMMIAVCTTPERTMNMYGERGEMYLRQQAGAAIQTLLLALEEKEIAACWVGHFWDEGAKKILGIPEKILLEALIPIGSAREKPRTRRHPTEIDSIIFFDKYKSKKRQKKPSIY